MAFFSRFICAVALCAGASAVRASESLTVIPDTCSLPIAELAPGEAAVGTTIGNGQAYTRVGIRLHRSRRSYG